MSKESKSIPTIPISSNNIKVNSQATTPVINMMASVSMPTNTRTNQQKKYTRYTNGVHMITSTHRIKNGVPQDLINGIWVSQFTPEMVPANNFIPSNAAVKLQMGKKGGKKQTRRGRKSLHRKTRTRR